MSILSTILFIGFAVFGFYIFFGYNIILTRQRAVASARSSVVTLEMVKAELIKTPEPTEKVKQAIANTERDLSLAKMELRSAIVRYNEAVRDEFPSSMIAKVRGFEEDRSHIK